MIINFCKEAGFNPLPLKEQHTLLMKTLKKDANAAAHKDPYDWLLVSQAKHEGMKLITYDSKLKHYLEDCILAF